MILVEFYLRVPGERKLAETRAMSTVPREGEMVCLSEDGGSNVVHSVTWMMFKSPATVEVLLKV